MARNLTDRELQDPINQLYWCQITKEVPDEVRQMWQEDAEIGRGILYMPKLRPRGRSL